MVNFLTSLHILVLVFSLAYIFWSYFFKLFKHQAAKKLQKVQELINSHVILATSKTWTHTLDPDPGSGP